MFKQIWEKHKENKNIFDSNPNIFFIYDLIFIFE